MAIDEIQDFVTRSGYSCIKIAWKGQYLYRCPDGVHTLFITRDPNPEANDTFEAAPEAGVNIDRNIRNSDIAQSDKDSPDSNYHVQDSAIEKNGDGDFSQETPATTNATAFTAPQHEAHTIEASNSKGNGNDRDLNLDSPVTTTTAAAAGPTQHSANSLQALSFEEKGDNSFLDLDSLPGATAAAMTGMQHVANFLQAFKSVVKRGRGDPDLDSLSTITTAAMTGAAVEAMQHVTDFTPSSQLETEDDGNSSVDPSANTTAAAIEGMQNVANFPQASNPKEKDRNANLDIDIDSPVTTATAAAANPTQHEANTIQASNSEDKGRNSDLDIDNNIDINIDSPATTTTAAAANPTQHEADSLQASNSEEEGRTGDLDIDIDSPVTTTTAAAADPSQHEADSLQSPRLEEKNDDNFSFDRPTATTATVVDAPCAPLSHTEYTARNSQPQSTPSQTKRQQPCDPVSDTSSSSKRQCRAAIPSPSVPLTISEYEEETKRLQARSEKISSFEKDLVRLEHLLEIASGKPELRDSVGIQPPVATLKKKRMIEGAESIRAIKRPIQLKHDLSTIRRIYPYLANSGPRSSQDEVRSMERIQQLIQKNWPNGPGRHQRPVHSHSTSEASYNPLCDLILDHDRQRSHQQRQQQQQQDPSHPNNLDLEDRLVQALMAQDSKVIPRISKAAASATISELRERLNSAHLQQIYEMTLKLYAGEFIQARILICSVCYLPQNSFAHRNNEVLTGVINTLNHELNVGKAWFEVIKRLGGPGALFFVGAVPATPAFITTELRAYELDAWLGFVLEKNPWIRETGKAVWEALGPSLIFGNKPLEETLMIEHLFEQEIEDQYSDPNTWKTLFTPWRPQTVVRDDVPTTRVPTT